MVDKDPFDGEGVPVTDPSQVECSQTLLEYAEHLKSLYPHPGFIENVDGIISGFFAFQGRSTEITAETAAYFIDLETQRMFQGFELALLLDEC